MVRYDNIAFSNNTYDGTDIILNFKYFSELIEILVIARKIDRNVKILECNT